MLKNKLFVLGSVNIDLSISCDRIPFVGETINGQDFMVTLGGKGCNQAFYANQLGMETNLIACLGNDQYAEKVINELQETEIELNISRKDNETTGVAVIVKSEGDNRIILSHGANYSFNKDDLKKLDEIREGDFFLTQLEIPYKIAEHSIRNAKLKGAITILNPAPATIKNNDIFKYTDIIILNETEAQEITKINISDKKDYYTIGNFFLHNGIKHVILTLGGKGCLYISENETFLIPANKVNVINTTGAGDSFIGAFISEFNRTQEIKKSLIFATFVAGKVCENQGVQVKNILKNEKGKND